jgi:hypothetical protein
MARVSARVLKTEIRKFPSVFECSRGLNLATNAYEIIYLQLLSITVRATIQRAKRISNEKRRSIELSCLHRQPTGSCSPVHRIDVAGFPCISWPIGSVPKRPWVAA